MNQITKQDIDNFIKEAEKGRSIPLSKEAILEINEVARQAEIEEQEEENKKNPPVAAISKREIEVSI